MASTEDRGERERLSAVASTGLDAISDPTMDRLAGLVARLLDAEVSLVSLVDGERQFFPGQHGLRGPWSQMRQTPLAESICRLVVETGEPVQVDDTASDGRLVDHAARPVLGVGSYLGVPLSDAEGNVLGSLCAIGGGSRRWTDEERQLLTDLGFGASSELRARIAATAATRATERVQLMADASGALNASLDVEAALAGMLDVVVPALATWGVVWVRPEPDAPPLVLARHADEPVDARLRAMGLDGDTAFVASPVVRDVLEGRSSSPTLGADAAATALAELVGADDAGLLALAGALVVPVVDRSEPIGVLVLGPAPGVDRFSSLDVALAVDLGRRAGSSLRNASAYGHARAMATTLQRSLLPSLPAIPGLGLCGVYEPASTGAEVGGDWYDVAPQADGSVSVTIGDVTGHSIEAAAAMGRLAGAIRCYAFEGLGPAAIIGRLDGLRAYLLKTQFATCICVRMRPHPHGWALDVSNAGHLPPILVSAGGEATVLEVARGPLVGPYAAPERAEAELVLPWGSTLLLYTDGLVERRDEVIDVSVERLRQLAADIVAHAPVEDVCTMLAAEARPDGSDDVAVLCVRAVPPG